MLLETSAFSHLRETLLDLYIALTIIKVGKKRTKQTKRKGNKKQKLKPKDKLLVSVGTCIIVEEHFLNEIAFNHTFNVATAMFKPI